jgi:hypothetical protein
VLEERDENRVSFDECQTSKDRKLIRSKSDALGAIVEIQIGALFLAFPALKRSPITIIIGVYPLKL